MGVGLVAPFLLLILIIIEIALAMAWYRANEHTQYQGVESKQALLYNFEKISARQLQVSR